MNKRRIVPFILMLIVAVATLCGTVIAYMFQQTEYKNNRFTPAQVSCAVRETIDADVTQKTSIKVENTGNIDAYLRIGFVSYWVTIAENGSAEIVAKPSAMPSIRLASGWLQGSDHTYYYQSPVAPGALTGELLASEIVLAEEDGYYQVVEVFAEAIQSKPQNAVTSSWHVELDGDSNVIAVP